MGTLSVDKLMKTSTGAAEFTLPATDGAAGTVLQTDGSGQLSVATVGSSGIATDAVGSSQIAANAVTTTEIVDDAVTIAKLAATGTASATTFLRGDNAWAAAGGGKILQCLQATKTDTQTTTNADFVDITGLSVAITPAATTSKILVFANVCTVGTVGSAASFTRIVRDSTAIAIGDAAGSRLRVSANGYAPDAGDNRHHSTVWLDSPSTTSATTYKAQFTANGTNTGYINRTQTDTDSTGYARSVSTITVMEIGV